MTVCASLAGRISAVLFSLLVLALLLQSPGVFADELLMRDGSHLVGKVVKREQEILEFKTSFAGVINVKWSEVVELKSDKPMKLLLSGDRILKTQQIHVSDKELTVFGAAGEPDQEIEQGVIEYINPEPWRTGEGYKFTGLANLAFQRERGNTDKDELDMDGNLVWRSQRRRFKAFGELERDHNNNKKTTDDWNIDGAYNHFLTGKWYSGANMGFEHDSFADLDLRSKLGPIMGYQWFEGKQMNLSTEAGPIYVNERFIEADNNDYIGAGWWINFDRYLFGDFMQFYHRQVGLWNLTTTENLVWDAWTGLRFPLILGLVASTEMKVEYDSSVSGDTKEVDTTFKLKLGYQW